MKLFIIPSIIILHTLYFILYTSPASAYQMQDNGTIIESDDMSIFKRQLTPSPTAPTSRINKKQQKSRTTAAKESTPEDFRLSTNSLFIDFGEVETANPIIRTASFIISNYAAPSYLVYVSQNHNLLEENGTSIPDTTCDNGSCSEHRTAPWQSPLTYGYGFSCDNRKGIPCLSGFAHPGYYAQLANVSIDEEASPIFSSNRGTSEAEITYKVNIPPSQANAAYSNVVTYILVPGF